MRYIHFKSLNLTKTITKIEAYIKMHKGLWSKYNESWDETNLS